MDFYKEKERKKVREFGVQTEDGRKKEEFICT